MTDAARKLRTPQPANDNGLAVSADDVVECPQCGCTGRVERRVKLIDRPGFRAELDDCGTCDGSGYVLADELEDCPACDGKGGIWDEWGSKYERCAHCSDGLVTADQWQSVDAWLVNEFG